MGSTTTVSTTTYWDDAIIHALNSGKLTILTGSAISMFGPTYLPTGAEAATAIKQMLLDEYVHKDIPHDDKLQKQLKRKIWRLICDLPFESVIQLLGEATNSAKAADFIHALIATSTFNFVHEFLAASMATAPATEGPSLAVITTNYDLGIENAILKTQPKLHYRRIISKADAIKPLGNEPVLFKVHGSDAPHSPYHFVMTHDQESILPRWQTRLLHQLIDNRVLLVVGYSGMDLDILPALGKCKWSIFRSVRPLEGLGKKGPYGFAGPPFRIDEQKETLGPNADLQEALQRIQATGIKITTKNSPGLRSSSSTRISLALESIPPEQRLLWIALMIVHSGSWALGSRALNIVSGIVNYRKLAARADAFFYAGKYRTCAKQWQVLLSDTRASLTLAQKVRACCSAAASLNCAGDSFGAWLILLRAVIFLFRMAISNESDVLVRSFGLILQGVVVAVPFASYIPKLDWVESIIVELIRRMGSFPMASVIRRYTKPTRGALSLGQRAALVNEYRYAGYEALNRLEAGYLVADRDAAKWLFRSIIWANRLDDRPGLAKAYLGMWRLYLLVNKPEDALECWKKGWQYTKEVDYIGWRGYFAYHFAAAAEKAAQIFPGSTEWIRTPDNTSLRLGKIAISLLSVR